MSLLARLLVTLLTLLGLTASAIAVTAATASAIPEYAYGDAATCPPAPEATTERGPPTTSNGYTPYQRTVDDLLQRVSTCSELSAASAYLDTSQVVRITPARPTTQRQVQVADAQIVVFERGGGLRTATLSNGTKINARPFSSGKRVTLEIDTPGNLLLKLRYE